MDRVWTACGDGSGVRCRAVLLLSCAIALCSAVLSSLLLSTLLFFAVLCSSELSSAVIIYCALLCRAVTRCDALSTAVLGVCVCAHAGVCSSRAMPVVQNRTASKRHRK